MCIRHVPLRNASRAWRRAMMSSGNPPATLDLSPTFPACPLCSAQLGRPVPELLLGGRFDDGAFPRTTTAAHLPPPWAATGPANGQATLTAPLGASWSPYLPLTSAIRPSMLIW
eukprot:EG_transcript_19150